MTVFMAALFVACISNMVYGQPGEGNQGGRIILEAHRTPSGIIDAAPVELEKDAIIDRVEGGGLGISIVKIEDGKEVEIMNVSSPSEAEGKRLSAGIYKVYPHIPEFGGGGAYEVTVQVYLTLIRG